MIWTSPSSDRNLKQRAAVGRTPEDEISPAVVWWACDKWRDVLSGDTCQDSEARDVTTRRSEQAMVGRRVIQIDWMWAEENTM